MALVRRCACPALLGQVSAARTCGREGGLEVTVQEQQGRVKHKTGEGEMENKDIHATNTFFHELEPCVYVTRMRSVQM